MSTVVRLELPDELARRAVALASSTNRRIEDAIVEWIGRAVGEPVVEALANDELLTVCDSTLEATDQERLSELLTAIRERQLPGAEQAALDQLMSMYRAGMVRKARAINEAVAGVFGRGWAKMRRETIPAEIGRRVRQAARDRCGYCLSPSGL